MFQDLGIIDDFLPIGNKILGLSMFVNGKRIAMMSYDELDTPFPFLLAVWQKETEAVLGKYLQSLGVSVEWSTELVGFTDSDSGLRATLRQSDGGEETFDAAWLVGCDGAHSSVRDVLGFGFEGVDYKEHFFLADVDMVGDLPHDEVLDFYHPAGPLHIVPLRPPCVRIEGILPSAPTNAAPTLEEVEAVTRERTCADIRLRDPIWLAYYFVHRKLVTQHSKGRVFLAGDAVHIHSPMGGQGLNTGLQDAYNLAWKLALVYKGRAPRSLLDTYEAERRPIARSVMAMTARMDRMDTVHGHFSQALRNHALQLMMSQEIVQRRLENKLSELQFNYRESPISVEHEGSRFGTRRFAGGPRPGERALDVYALQYMGQQTTLLELLRGPTFVLLLLPGAEPRPGWQERLRSIARAIEETRGDHIKTYLVAPGSAEPDGEIDPQFVIDPELALHHRYGAEHESMYVIRPDGYIGFRGEPVDLNVLRGYLARVITERVGARA
jgi:2-polyprenyl-6-methoxyphenol hydroxylase-like FAD-dependent oxidoreductase